jgi:hypothetical protein
MKYSTLRVLKKDEIITVNSDVEALDFMVVIKGALIIEFLEYDKHQVL